MFTIYDEDVRPLDVPPAPEPAIVAKRSAKRFLIVVLAVIVGLSLFAGLLAAALALGARQTSDDATTVSTGAESQSIQAPAAAAPAPVAAQPAPAVDTSLPWLRVDGFGEMTFGTSADQVISTVAQRFGQPTIQNVGGDCPGTITTLVDFDGFTLHMTDDALGGWVYYPTGEGLRTPSGVRPGMSIDDLKATYVGVSIFETSLGTEFYYEVPAGYMAGVMTEDGRAVEALYAGETCFFR